MHLSLLPQNTVFFFSFVIIPVAFVLHSVHCLRSILVSIVVCIARMFMTNKKKKIGTRASNAACCGAALTSMSRHIFSFVVILFIHENDMIAVAHLSHVK